MTNNNIYFIANWKMHGNPTSVNSIRRVIGLSKTKKFRKVRIIYCPPYTLLDKFTNKTKRNLVNVFVPTTPNPTSGFLLMFPKEDVIYLDITFEQASKFIVSAGSTNP